MSDAAFDANIYVYALMRAEDVGVGDMATALAALEEIAAVDALDAPIMAAPCGPVVALVSSIETAEVLATRRNLLTHARALEAMMTLGPALPMRFGLITTDAEQIAATISPHAGRLGRLLDELDGCVEIGVKIAWDRTRAMREIVAEQPGLTRAYQSLQGRSETETHYERIELGRRVEAAMREKRTAEAERYAETLGAHARDRVIQEPDDDMMVLKADFLVERSSEPALMQAVEAIEAADPERVSISYVGPAPVYNFVNLQLNWVTPDDPDDQLSLAS